MDGASKVLKNMERSALLEMSQIICWKWLPKEIQCSMIHGTWDTERITSLLKLHKNIIYVGECNELMQSGRVSGYLSSTQIFT